jgi:hypothetical protein
MENPIILSEIHFGKDIVFILIILKRGKTINGMDILSVNLTTCKIRASVLQTQIMRLSL